MHNIIDIAESPSFMNLYLEWAIRSNQILEQCSFQDKCKEMGPSKRLRKG